MNARINPLHLAGREVLIASNPTAGSKGRHQAVEELAERCRALGLTARVVTDLDQLTVLSREALAAGNLRAVIAAGGDGTLAEVVNRTPVGTPITVFPKGTCNLLARHVGIKQSPADVARLVCEGAVATLDAGLANGRVFLLVVGCGFDGDVAHRLHLRRGGGNSSWVNWIRPLLASFRGYHYPELRVYCDSPDGGWGGEPHRARWAFVANLPCYAGGLVAASTATGLDGKLDVALFAGGSWWHNLRYAYHVFWRQHHQLPDFRATVAGRVRIEADQPAPYQLDGDPGGYLPLDIEVLPGRLSLIVPQAFARTLDEQLLRTPVAGAT